MLARQQPVRQREIWEERGALLLAFGQRLDFGRAAEEAVFVLDADEPGRAQLVG